MPELAIQNMLSALQVKERPTITMWNRLEARPRTHVFDRALRAEIRDPLWMLCKQWQMGEFEGDDAGSPIGAKILIDHSPVNKYQAADHPSQHFPEDIPLEAMVERRSIAFKRGLQDIALDVRMLMGRHWLKMIRSLAGDYAHDFIGAYSIDMPSVADSSGAEVGAHPESWQTFAAVSGRKMDGAKLYAYLTENPVHHAYDGLPVSETDQGPMDDLAVKFTSWFERQFFQPPADGADAWKPERLEYQCSISADEQGQEQVMQAEEYYHGRLDWFNFDISPAHNGLGTPAGPAPVFSHPDPRTEEFLPTPIEYDGMPHTRWWTFEEGKTNFGDINPATTDIAKLLFMEFGLVYANDWFMLPHELPVATLSRVRGLAVTNVFGERIWVKAAGSGLDDNWQRWSMYNLSVKGNHREMADTGLLLLPTVPKIQESNRRESVVLIRDEMANMVWGVETQVPLASGHIKRGSEAGAETKSFYQRLIDEAIEDGSLIPPPDTKAAPVRYRVMNSVPENWIPFIPVHLENDHRNTRLQRAAMPRILDNDDQPPQKVRPKTALLRQGMDQSVPEAFYLNEEEVPRAGVIVRQAFQRTRWYNGKVYTWIGAAKRTGRGEGSSGLAFDTLV